ncbi:MAG: N-acetyltransferase [Chthoniobacteraceae bacterium]
MTVEPLLRAPDRELTEALDAFERGFTYPLGHDRRFRITHGEDYARFFRAIDAESGTTFVALSNERQVLGTLGVAVRDLRFPDRQCRRAAYLGDLKTAPDRSRGRTLLRLGKEVTKWCLDHGAVVAYGIVMDGTDVLPPAYTGKLGIHSFQPVSKLCVFRLPVSHAPIDTEPRGLHVDSAAINECFVRLSSGAFAPLGGDPEVRSASAPAFLMNPDGSACGVLEDTRKAKRLIELGGDEMVAAHLSKFAYRDVAAGVRLIRAALAHCARERFAPALFVAVPADEAPHFAAQLHDFEGMVQAGATIFGTYPDLVSNRWQISTSEI